jgi:uncharacterized protein (DUF2235 family)
MSTARATRSSAEPQQATQSDTPPLVATIRWILLAKYCEVTGDTSDAVHARRRKKQWIDGVQTIVDPNGNLRVNPEEINKWVEQNQKSGG